jgi:hypothetical protein
VLLCEEATLSEFIDQLPRLKFPVNGAQWRIWTRQRDQWTLVCNPAYTMLADLFPGRSITAVVDIAVEYALSQPGSPVGPFAGESNVEEEKRIDWVTRYQSKSAHFNPDDDVPIRVYWRGHRPGVTFTAEKLWGFFLHAVEGGLGCFLEEINEEDPSGTAQARLPSNLLPELATFCGPRLVNGVSLFGILFACYRSGELQANGYFIKSMFAESSLQFKPLKGTVINPSSPGGLYTVHRVIRHFAICVLHGS